MNMTTRSLTELHGDVLVAEAVHESVAKRTYAQRAVAKEAQRVDIMDRCGGPLPRLRGSVEGMLADERALRGELLSAPLTPLQKAAYREKKLLEHLEGLFSQSKARLDSARGALLAFENKLLTARREEDADTILKANGIGVDAQLDELVALCPDERVVRLDQRFALTPKVLMALAYRIDPARNLVDVPVNESQGLAGIDWSRARAAVLAEAEQPPVAA
jgi:hypothetical protein